MSGSGSRLYVSEFPGGGGEDGFAPNYASWGGGTMSTIVDRQWDTTDPSTTVLPPSGLSGTDSHGMTWFESWGPAPLIATPASLTTTIGQTIPATPDNATTVMAVRWPSGFTQGQTPFGCYYSGSSISAKRLYVSMYVLMPTGFDSNGNNIKWVIYAQNGGSGRNHVMMLSSGDVGFYRGPWVAQQGGGETTSVGGDANLKSGAIVNLSTPTIAADSTWRCVEWFAQMESSPGAADGVLKFAIDGTLTGHWANIAMSAATGDPAVLDSFYFAPFYGGGGGAAPSDQYICLGRTFCAGGN